MTKTTRPARRTTAKTTAKATRAVSRERTQDLQAIVQRAAARPVVDPRPADVILGYGERPPRTKPAVAAERQAMLARHRRQVQMARIDADAGAEARRQAKPDTQPYALALVAYRVTLEPDRAEGTISVFCPSFPAVQTWGDNPADALDRAADALATVIEAYIADHRALPPPSWVRTRREDQLAASKRLADLGGQVPMATAPRRRRQKPVTTRRGR